MSKIIGIDLGTGNSVVSVYEGNKVTVIPNSEGAMTTPSVVAFDQNGRLVGRVAKSQAAVNPIRTVSSVKRFIGRLRSEVASEEKLVAYKVVGEQGELAMIEVDGQKMAPQQISAAVLQDLKKSAEAYLGERVTGAVISVPAYFSSAQREATKEAGIIAGLDVRRIISEPTAAALAYGLDKKGKQRVAVFDVGQGTYDVSIVAFENGVFEVKAVNGDAFLGGDNWDKALVDFVADEFKAAHGVDLRLDPLARQRLTEACEKCKCDLSRALQTQITLPYIAAVNGTPQHLSTTITRAKFESITTPLFERLRAPALQAMADAKIVPKDLDEVILVGGATRMPRAQEICMELFGNEPNKSVNPDLAVSIGCAIQGSVLSGNLTDLILLDVTPLSLSVETQGGIATVLIPRNTTIPVEKGEVFSTASDNQPAVDVHVLQGERKLASGNRTLGRFQLTGIPPAPRGAPQIEVHFSIDSNGIVSVSAKDKGTGKEQKITITASSGLAKEDIERMVKDAASFDAEDKERADTIEARNSADTLVYYAERFMRENTKAISATTHEGVKTSIDALRAVVERYGTKAELVAATDAADIALKRMQEEVFKASGQQAAPQPQPPKPAAPPPKVDIGMPDEAF